MKSGQIHVAAAVIQNAQQQILIAKRPEHLHQGGLWEFPGGKIEPNEKVQAALVRELDEELAIHATHMRPMIRVAHDYGDKQVLLDVWLVDGFSGTAHGQEGQEVRWVEKNELSRYTFPAANTPIITAACLPERYLISGEFSDRQEFCVKLNHALQEGIKLVQLRAKHLPITDYLSLAKTAHELCTAHDSQLLLNTTIENFSPELANGLHLSSASLMSISERPIDKQYLLAASVHNEQELRHAQRIDVDFVVLAPVQATRSHPATPPIGWDKFYELTELATVPVFALGGMQERDLETVWQHGGQGIAAISAWWND